MPDKQSFNQIKEFLNQHADAIQKLATKHHKKFLGGKTFRSEVLQRHQQNHVKVILELSKYLAKKDLKKGANTFKKLGRKLAADSAKDNLTIEETVDGTAFLKQAIWEKIEKAGLLTKLETQDFYRLSQTIGSYIDILSSELAFTFHQKYIQQLLAEKDKRVTAETAKQHIEKRLKLEKIRSYDLLMQAPAAIAVFHGKNHIFEMVNKHSQKLIGKTAKELIGQPVRNAIPEVASQGILRILNTVYKTGKEFTGNEFPSTVQDPENGKPYQGYFNFIAQSIKNENKKVEGIFLYAVEVTKQVINRKKIEESEQRLQLAQAAARMGTFDWNIQTNEIVWTPELEKLYGLRPGGFKGSYLNAKKYTHPEDYPQVQLETQKAIQQKETLNTEYRVIWPDKSIHWLLAKGKTFYDPQDKPISMLGVVADISDRKKAGEIQNYFSSIIESSDDAIISQNVDGTITSWNKGAEHLYGYTAKEIISQPVSILMPPEKKDDFPKIMKDLFEGRKVEHYETKRLTKNGEIIDVSITVSPIRDQNGKIIGASKIARDITEYKRLEQQKDDFISIATHELKTPVTSIKAYAQVLHSIFIKKEDSKSAEYLAKMDAQLNKLTNLIADLLDVNKIQSGQLQLHSDYFNFNELVEEAVEELQRTTTRHTLIKNLAPSKIIFGDRDRIGQVLTNLISNAIKYSPHSEKIVVSTQATKKLVTLSVRDFGVGIPKEKQDKVFEKFFRVSGPKQDTYPGLGLGLYISAEIIKRQNGRIWVESIKDQGSTFYFSLPTAPKKKP